TRVRRRRALRCRRGRRAPALGRAKRLVAEDAGEAQDAGAGGDVDAYALHMTRQRRTALVSVIAAIVLIAVKLATGLATHSLGLVSEAIHSGTDLVAALLTFFAVGVAARPADAAHTYGHGKAEHLAALAEAGILVLASLFVAARAIMRLAGSSHGHV